MSVKNTISKFKLLFVLSLFVHIISYAQNKTITGTVTDDLGESIPGVSIFVKGTSNGTITNFEGNYSLTGVNPTSTLVFSFIGMETKELLVGAKSIINVQLMSETQSVDEVVVIGYSPVAREKVLGAMSSVKAEEMSQASPVGALDAVQGKLAGVQILSNGGPGGGFDIRVRGVSTFGGGTSPLYVVDGQQLDDIDNLDPDNIASMEVLKDGATAAIYGSKAANGVVLITTKSGKSEELRVDVSSITGVKELVGDIRVANTNERILYEKLRQSNSDALTALEKDSLSLLRRNSYDLQDLITRRALRQQLNVGISGGGNKTKFYWNNGFLNEEGVVINSGYKRFNSLLKVDIDVSKKFKMGTKFNLTYDDQNGVSESAVFTQLVQRIPYYPLFEPDGSYSPELAGRANPLLNTTRTSRTRNFRAQTFSYLQWEIIPNLTFKSTLGVNYRLNKFNSFNPSNTVNPTTPIPVGRERFGLSYDIQQENFVNYKNSWGNHSLAGFAGMQTQIWRNEDLDLKANWMSDYIHTLNNIDPTTLVVNNGENYEHSLSSLFGGINYDFKNKYLLGFTLRRDGSSRFGENNKYGYFPSATIGWRLGRESFMQSIEQISGLLLRASYGVTGNERIGNYEYIGSYTPGAIYNGVNGVYQSRFGNPDLSWESTVSSNLGLDLGMFENRLSINLDVWQKKTTDLLATVPLPKESGFSGMLKNVGAVNNNGLDLAVSGSIIKSKDFSWNSSFNISFVKNEVVKLAEGTPFESGKYRIEEGQPIGNIYGYNNKGVFQYDESNAFTPEGNMLKPNFNDAGEFENYTLNGTVYAGDIKRIKVSGQTLKGGDIIWEDLDGDFNITAADRQVLGNGLPDYFGGFSNEFKYKSFSISTLFDFTIGGDIYRAWDEARNDLNSSGETPGPDRINGSWKKPGDITVFPRLSRVSQNRLSPNSYFVTSGDYIKWRYIRLSYGLPKNVLNRVDWLKKASVSLALNNVLTWTNYLGFNPELGNRGNALQPGLDNLRYPNDREIILGVKLQF